MSAPDERPTAEQPRVDPAVRTAPTAEQQPRRWWSAIPKHLGRARTSTVVLGLLFLAIGALYLNVRPEAPGTTTGNGGAVTEPAPTTGGTPAPPTTTVPPSPTEAGQPTGEEETTGAGGTTGQEEPTGAGGTTGQEEPTTGEETPGEDRTTSPPAPTDDPGGTAPSAPGTTGPAPTG